MLVRIWIIGWTYLTTSSAVVYKVETETSSKPTIPAAEEVTGTNLTFYADTAALTHWLEWSEWSTCSRSCGGGIRSQTRPCLESKDARSSNGSKSRLKKVRRRKCLGTTKRHQTCNNQVCPQPNKDFRTVQCESYNKQAFAGNYYTWEVFYDDKNQCALNCRPVGYNFYATLNTSVIDGTPCKLSGYERSICVDGRCQFVGCDGVIGGQHYDVCGVCGGDNSTCRLVSGLFTKPFLIAGYNYIADIPENACNLNISEIRKTTNLIALRYKNGTYILNGDFAASPPGEINAAGTVFTFFRATNTAADFIFSPGPILQSLELLLLYRQVNSGIKYEYRVPMVKSFSVSTSTSVKKHRDTDRHLSDNAVDHRKYDTTDKYESTYTIPFPSSIDLRVDDSDFQEIINDEEVKPQSSKKRKNKFKWKVTSYTSCSRSCGEGTRTGIHSCVKEGDHDQVVADRKCTNNQGKKPADQIISCNLQKCPAEWMTGEWGQCSVSCGEGVEKRDLICVRELSSSQKLQANDDECVTSQPPNILRTRPCFRKPCDNGSAESVKPYWATGTWSMCSAKCGAGTKTRTVKCMAENEDECPPDERPASEITCIMGPCQAQGSAQWLTTEWSPQCTEKCGVGVQTRKVACSAKTLQDSACSEDSKPETIRSCSSNDQCSARWFSGPWTLCSMECGWGKQTRSLVCLSYDSSSKSYSAAADTLCGEKEKPSAEQACFVKSCDVNWYFSPWSSCSKLCDSGILTRKILCLQEDFSPSISCKENEKPAAKQICNTQKCPYQTEEPDNESPRSLLYSDSSCVDQYGNCNLVVKARLCNSKYYRQFCCRSCNGVKQH